MMRLLNIWCAWGCERLSGRSI